MPHYANSASLVCARSALVLFSLLCSALMPAHASTQADLPLYTLAALQARASRESPALATSRAGQLAAQAGITTASAYPNPEIGLEPGRLGARRPGADTGSLLGLSITQPIETPGLRQARLQSAAARVELAAAETTALHSNLNAAIRDAFFNLFKIKALWQALSEDLLLTEQIRDGIAARVRSGEAPRFDILRADNEVASMRKNRDATVPRIRQAQFALRQLVSPTLEEQFDISITAADTQMLTEADYQALKQAVLERNPEVLLARQSLSGAERQIEFERQQVLPRVELRASHERDPSVQLLRIGAQVVVPLLDRRAGPIAEARAQAHRAGLALAQHRFDAQAQFDGAWQAYQSALAQVNAIEGGILERARQVLSVAEAAYRLGERGIIEYLDAQRQFRLVRTELLEARFELQRARTDLERIAGR